MTKLLGLFLVFCHLGHASALELLSAKRDPQTSFATIEGKLSSRFRSHGISNSAYTGRTSVEKVSPSEVAAWNSVVPIETAFTYIRDKRFLTEPYHKNFLRRISWLYPDDGCPVRADLMSKLLQSQSYDKPSKIFAYGDLYVKTQNSPLGGVTWWYHVAAAYQHQGKIFVFDPAIDPKKPLTLKEWAERMGHSSHSPIEVKVCDHNAIDPDSKCFGDQGATNIEITEAQEDYLEKEWERVEDLGADPLRVLGDEPPWKATRR